MRVDVDPDIQDQGYTARPTSPTEASLGTAYAASGQTGDAEMHLERALDLDPLNLSAAEQLISLYERDGKTEKAEVLKSRIGKAFH